MLSDETSSFDITSSYPHEGIPWMMFIVVAMLFFLSQNDLFFSKRFAQHGLPNPEEVATLSEEGSIRRQISLICLGGYSFVSLLRRSRNRLKLNGLLGLLLIAFVILSFASIGWAYDTFITAKRLIMFGVILITAIAIAERLSFLRIIQLIIFTCGIYLLVGILMELVLGTFHPLSYGYRFCGTNDPNVGSWWLAIMVLASMSHVVISDEHRPAFFMLLFLSLNFLFLSKTRTSLMSVLIAIFAYWNFTLPRAKSRFLTLVMVMFVCIIYFAVDILGSKNLLDLVLLGRDSSTAITLTGRIPVWNECIPFILQRPLVGYGFNGFWIPKHIMEISERADWGEGGVPWALNGYIDLALGVGLIGAVLYVVVFLGAIANCFSMSRITKDGGYAFAYCMLVFYGGVSFLESVPCGTGFSTCILYTILAKFAFCNLSTNQEMFIGKYLRKITIKLAR